MGELRKEVGAMRSGQLADIATASDGEMTATCDEIGKSLGEAGAQLHPPMSYQYAASEAASEVQPVAKPARKPRKAATRKTGDAPKSKAAARAKPKARPTPRKAPAKPRRSKAEPAS